MSQPRVHHFIPQSWQRRFADPADANERAWVYEYESDTVELRSPKKVMQGYDLYTNDPFGIIDTSLETTELQKIDNEGAQVMTAVLGGDLSAKGREDLATFLAVAILRTPARKARTMELIQETLLQVIEAHHAADFDDFVRTVQEKRPGLTFTQQDYQDLLQIPADGLERWVEDRIARANQPGGDPDLPATDAIRDPTATIAAKNALLGLQWVLKRDPGRGFVLGDGGVNFVAGDLAQGARVALSAEYGLFMSPADAPTTHINVENAQAHDIAALNAESAALSKRWLIGSSEATVSALKSQVGRA